MFNIEPIDISTMTLGEIVKMNGYLYRVVDTTNKTIEEKAEAVSEADKLKSMSVEDLAKDPKYSEMFEDKSPKEERKKKFEKYYSKGDEFARKANQAPYVCMMADDTGTIWIIPKSNGALRVEFNDKNKAETYLKKFRQLMHYSTNSVDTLNVMDFYNLLNIVVPPDIKPIAEKYEWTTVSSLCDLTWVSSCANRTVDKEDTYGWCITKRARKKKEN